MKYEQHRVTLWEVDELDLPADAELVSVSGPNGRGQVQVVYFTPKEDSE